MSKQIWATHCSSLLLMVLAPRTQLLNVHIIQHLNELPIGTIMTIVIIVPYDAIIAGPDFVKHSNAYRWLVGWSTSPLIR